MKELKHTPGPWVLGYRVTEFELTIFGADKKRVCEMKSFSDPKPELFNDPNTEAADANAKLIAAAPELLANLQQCVIVLQVIDPKNPATKMAELAIKKATD